MIRLFFYKIFTVMIVVLRGSANNVPWELHDASFVAADTSRSLGLFRSDEGNPKWGYSYGVISHDSHGAPVAVVGPSSWHLEYPACGGLRQSPIHIDASHLSSPVANSLKPLRLVDYDDAAINDEWTLLNNGHSVQLTANFITPPQLQGGDLPGKYIFKQAHFHWGSNDLFGSEHVLNRQRYPIEIHLVHQKKTLSDTTATNYGDGLAVIGVFGQISTVTNPFFDELVRGMEQITIPQTATTVSLPGFTLNDLLPSNHSYVRYAGSLTTPPCSEAVIWSVLVNPLPTSRAQLNVFRSLSASHKQTSHTFPDSPSTRATSVLQDNFRPLQLLNERSVQYFRDTGLSSNAC